MIKDSFKLVRRAYQHNARDIRTNGLYAVGLELVSVAGLYILNQTYGKLYEAIQTIDTAGIWHNIGMFALIAMGLVLVNGYMAYFINRLAFALRVGLTKRELLTLKPSNIVPNYEQRVQEDYKRFAEASCDLWFAVLKSALHLPVFLGVIIGLTQWYVGAGVLFAVILGTILTRVVAKRLVMEQSVQETNEAEFRKGLKSFQFLDIRRQFVVVNRLFKRLVFVQAGLGQAFVLLPFVILMPFYVSKMITMGSLFQSVNALGKIIDSLSVLIDSRQTIVNVETCLVRLQPLIKD